MGERGGACCCDNLSCLGVVSRDVCWPGHQHKHLVQGLQPTVSVCVGEHASRAHIVFSPISRAGGGLSTNGPPFPREPLFDLPCIVSLSLPRLRHPYTPSHITSTTEQKHQSVILDSSNSQNPIVILRWSSRRKATSHSALDSPPFRCMDDFMTDGKELDLVTT